MIYVPDLITSVLNRVIEMRTRFGQQLNEYEAKLLPKGCKLLTLHPNVSKKVRDTLKSCIRSSALTSRISWSYAGQNKYSVIDIYSETSLMQKIAHICNCLSLTSQSTCIALNRFCYIHRAWIIWYRIYGKKSCCMSCVWLLYFVFEQAHLAVI